MIKDLYINTSYNLFGNYHLDNHKEFMILKLNETETESYFDFKSKWNYDNGY